MMVLDSKNITVLMVDDDEINRQMAEMILTKKLPYKVITAESGMRCIELMHQFDVNLVLLDVDMPVWDGFKTLAAIRTDRKLKDTPVIMLTAAADLGSVVRQTNTASRIISRSPSCPMSWPIASRKSSGTIGNSRASAEGREIPKIGPFTKNFEQQRKRTRKRGKNHASAFFFSL